MSKIRINSMYVHLCGLLSSIIRENLKFRVSNTECWTFEHITDWQIYDKKNPSECGGEPYYFVEHSQSLYFGSGYLTGFSHDDRSKFQKVQLRVVCEFSEWVPAGQSFWTFRIWVQYSDGRIEKHFLNKYSFSKTLDEGEIPKNMRNAPPKRISFKETTESP